MQFYTLNQQEMLITTNKKGPPFLGGPFELPDSLQLIARAGV